MMRLSVLLIGLLAATASAAQDWTEQELEALRAKFILLDINGDDIITIQDMADERIRQFENIDFNGDGRILIGEFIGFRAPGADKYLTRRELELRKYTFYKWDFNLDRSLDKEEFLFQTQLSFNNLDADRSGEVDFAEFSRLPATRRLRAGR